MLTVKNLVNVRKFAHWNLHEAGGFEKVFNWLKTVTVEDKKLLYTSAKEGEEIFYYKLNSLLPGVTRFQFELVKRYLYGCFFETIE